MPTVTRIVSVGTTPILALPANPNRVGWRVTFLGTNIIAGNTGIMHVGRNVPPTTTTGDPISGSMITQTGEISEKRSYKDEPVFQGDLWIIASIAAQQVEVEETTDVIA